VINTRIRSKQQKNHNLRTSVMNLENKHAAWCTPELGFERGRWKLTLLNKNELENPIQDV
jgi:hypothetical protein